MTDGIESISSACKNKYASLIIGHDPKITLITLKAGTRLRKPNRKMHKFRYRRKWFNIMSFAKQVPQGYLSCRKRFFFF